MRPMTVHSTGLCCCHWCPQVIQLMSTLFPCLPCVHPELMTVCKAPPTVYMGSLWKLVVSLSPCCADRQVAPEYLQVLPWCYAPVTGFTKHQSWPKFACSIAVCLGQEGRPWSSSCWAGPAKYRSSAGNRLAEHTAAGRPCYRHGGHTVHTHALCTT